MYRTVYNVVVYDFTVVAAYLNSLDEAEVVKQCWLDCYPDLPVSIRPLLIPLNGGDF